MAGTGRTGQGITVVGVGVIAQSEVQLLGYILLSLPGFLFGPRAQFDQVA